MDEPVKISPQLLWQQNSEVWRERSGKQPTCWKKVLNSLTDFAHIIICFEWSICACSVSARACTLGMCIRLLTECFDIQESQLKSNVWRLVGNFDKAALVTSGILVSKFHKRSIWERGLWGMIMFTFCVHTQTSSFAPLALSNTGYANSLYHSHTNTDWPCFCSALKKKKPETWDYIDNEQDSFSMGAHLAFTSTVFYIIYIPDTGFAGKI